MNEPLSPGDEAGISKRDEMGMEESLQSSNKISFSEQDNLTTDTLPSHSSNRKKRRRVSRRKLVKRPKRRGEYMPNDTSEIEYIDVTQCILSDDEIKAEFLEDEIPDIVECEDGSVYLAFESQEPITEGLVPHLRQSSPGSRSASAASSREESSTNSKFDSSVTLRTESAISFRQSSLLALNPESRCQSAISLVSDTPEGLQKDQVETQYSPPVELINAGLAKFRNILPSYWIPTADNLGYHLLLFSDSTPKAIQREIFIRFTGEVSIWVHCEPVPLSHIELDRLLSSQLRCDESSLEAFCARGLSAARQVLQYTVCIGANHPQSREWWEITPDTYVDTNPYRESKYVETCRSFTCSRLVELGKRTRCNHCTKVLGNLRSRARNVVSQKNPAHTSTPNAFLSHKQALEKLKQQQEEIRKKDRKIAYLRKVRESLESKGEDIDDQPSVCR